MSWAVDPDTGNFLFGINAKKMIELLTSDQPAPGQKVVEVVMTAAQRVPITHDLSPKIWRRDYAIMRISEDGKQLRLAVWCPMVIEQGDYLILRNGNGTTRYRVDSVKLCGDPADMSFVEVIFAPREEGAG